MTRVIDIKLAFTDWFFCDLIILFKSCKIRCLTVYSYHVTCAFQSESTLYSCLNVKERLALTRREIWSLSDCNWTRTHCHLVHKRTLNPLAKLAHVRVGFESTCSHFRCLNLNKAFYCVRETRLLVWKSENWRSPTTT